MRKRVKQYSDQIALKEISRLPKTSAELDAKHNIPASADLEEDYDAAFIQAFEERKEEKIQKGYGAVQHPTSRIFEIGIDSIRNGTPSELFLCLLEAIGNKAEDTDVLALLFPEKFPRHIKTTTVRAAQRNIALVDKFRSHIDDYLRRPRRVILNGKSGLDAEWEREPGSYRQAMEEYKSTLSPDERKQLDRALKNHGEDILEWRDNI
nr:hypothetical protein [Herbaspirillum sp. ASV7]